AAKAESIRKSAESLQGASYEEIEDTMKTFESYLLEQTLKEFRKSIKEIRGDNNDEDPFMSQTTDMYMDQMLGTISKHMVDAYGQRMTKDLTDQTARMYGIDIPGEESKKAQEAGAAGADAADATDTAEEVVEEAAEQGAVTAAQETE
ncbi:MAG: hypothetical protein IJT32_05765, partial [Lachnospiraceae bacterium]|nr:hypothetical protein [Lachnospiraceae bacterium]